MTALSADERLQILDRIRDGDADALSVWFRRYKDPVYAFVFYRVGGDEDLAADATQATFVAALERLREFDPDRGEMLTWLRYLSRNIVRAALARHRRGVQLQAAWDGIDESLGRAFRRIDSERLPDEALQRDETRELVEMTLTNLPPQYRAVLEAKYIDARPLEEIARLRSTTVDSVKSMLRRAREAFRECFLTIAKLETSDV